MGRRTVRKRKFEPCPVSRCMVQPRLPIRPSRSAWVSHTASRTDVSHLGTERAGPGAAGGDDLSPLDIGIASGGIARANPRVSVNASVIRWPETLDAVVGWAVPSPLLQVSELSVVLDSSFFFDVQGYLAPMLDYMGQNPDVAYSSVCREVSRSPGPRTPPTLGAARVSRGMVSSVRLTALHQRHRTLVGGFAVTFPDWQRWWVRSSITWAQGSHQAEQCLRFPGGMGGACKRACRCSLEVVGVRGATRVLLAWVDPRDRRSHRLRRPGGMSVRVLACAQLPLHLP